MIKESTLLDLLKLNFLFCLLLAGLNGSFIQYTFTGLIFRFSSICTLILWMGFKYKQEKISCKFLSNHCLIAFISLFCYQLFTVTHSDSPAYGLSFIEGRFWVCALLIVFCDIKDDLDFQLNLNSCLQFILIYSVLYGFYQVEIAMPYLREELSFKVNSFIDERFAVRLNSPEMIGSYVFANLFSIYCAIMFIYSCSIKSNIWFKAILVGLSMCGIYFSAARGAIVCILLSIFIVVLVLLIVKKRWRNATVIGLVLVTIGFIFYGSLASRFYDSAFIRIGYWESTLNMIENNIFGIGIANFKEHYFYFMTENATEVKMAHNDHIQQFAELGIIGFCIYVLFYVLLIKTSLKNLSLPVQKNVEIIKTKHFLISGCIFIFYLLFSCLLIQRGQFDLPLYGMLFIILLFVVVIFIHKFSKSIKPSYPIISIFLIVYFILHSSIDFPFYDHHLLFLFLVIVFSQFSLKNKFLPKKVFLLLSVILISVSFICFIHFRDIYQGIITTEIAQNKEDIIECMEYNRMHTDSVVLWDTLLKKINTLAREKSLYLEVFYKETLNNCIRLRPNSGNLAFRKGKIETNDKIASNWFLRAQQFYPKNPRYMFAYAESLDKIGKTNDAIVWYKKAIERHHFAKKLSVNQWDFKLILLHSDQIKKANNTLLKIQSNAP